MAVWLMAVSGIRAAAAGWLVTGTCPGPGPQCPAGRRTKTGRQYKSISTSCARAHTTCPSPPLPPPPPRKPPRRELPADCRCVDAAYASRHHVGGWDILPLRTHGSGRSAHGSHSAALPCTALLFPNSLGMDAGPSHRSFWINGVINVSLTVGYGTNAIVQT